MKRESVHATKGFRAIDGAGVNLVRVLGNQTTDKYDPFLMLDSFDSVDPNDYILGFPTHPHRGMETITYLSSGSIQHEDSMGNKGLISGGGVQWMSAGSGILHSEMPQPSDRMLGVQIWLNIPAAEKMTPPTYHDIPYTKIPKVDIDGGSLRVIGGSYKDINGHQGGHIPIDFYAINLEKNQKFTIPTNPDHAAYVFLLEGDASIAGKEFEEKTAVTTTLGDELDIQALDTPVEILFLGAPRLDEPISWGGPIVMSNDDDLRTAFEELKRGTFIKDRVNKI